jgi:PTH2 family peptidyl-tRNA hydrolase
VVNQSLKMGKGKIAAQVGHAAVQAFLGAGVSHPSEVEAWLGSGQKKICLKAPDTSVFDELSKAARKQNIPHHIVQDAGHTQIPRGSSTVLALGPYDEAVLDELTGHLKLL